MGLAKEGRHYQYSEWLEFECEGKPTAAMKEYGEEFTTRARQIAQQHLRSAGGPLALSTFDEDAFAWKAYASIVGHGVGLWEGDGDTGLPGDAEIELDKVVKKDKKLVSLAHKISGECSSEAGEIKHEGGKWVLYSRHGRVLGRHPSRDAAIQQERAIHVHKGASEMHAGDYPDMEAALRGAQSRFDATHAMRGRNAIIFSPTSRGYVRRVGFREKGFLHWPEKGELVSDLPQNAEMIYQLIDSGWDPDAAPGMPMQRAAEELPTGELAVWRDSGRQDAVNVIDVNEIEEVLGPKPTRADIKAWLLRDFDSSQHEFPKRATKTERKMLIEAWADGWSSYAQAIMSERAKREELDRAQRQEFGPGVGEAKSQELAFYMYVELDDGSTPFVGTARGANQTEARTDFLRRHPRFERRGKLIAVPEIAADRVEHEERQAFGPRGAGEAGRVPKEAIEFFRMHAGYGYDPKKETEAEGRLRNARALAKAEMAASSRGWRVEWKHDPEPYDPGDTEYVPKEVLIAVLYDEKGDVRGSLGGIADPDRSYARVVEAELADEALYGETRARAERGPRAARENRRGGGPLHGEPLEAWEAGQDRSAEALFWKIKRQGGRVFAKQQPNGRWRVWVRLHEDQGEAMGEAATRDAALFDAWKKYKRGGDLEETPQAGEHEGSSIEFEFPSSNAAQFFFAQFIGRAKISHRIVTVFDDFEEARKLARLHGGTEVRDNPHGGEPLRAEDGKGAALWGYLSDEQREYVRRGFNTHDEPIAVRNVAIGDFAYAATSLAKARSDVRRGELSKTHAPVTLWHDPDKNIFFLIDGHHRLAEAIARKDKSIDVEIVGSGYNDYYATPSASEGTEPPKIEAYKAVLPWGGDGWVVNLDFIRNGLRTYGKTRKEAIEHAVRDIQAWKRGAWKSPQGGEPLPSEARESGAKRASSEGDAVPWVKIARDPAEYEAGMRRAKEIGAIDNPRQIYDLLSPALSREEQEVFLVVLLDVRQQCIGVAEVARGDRSRVAVSRAVVYRAVVKTGAESFMVVHNHPTGDPTPSPADRELTTAIMDGAEEVEVPCVDHVVIGMGRYYSFAEGKVVKVT